MGSVVEKDFRPGINAECDSLRHRRLPKDHIRQFGGEPLSFGKHVVAEPDHILAVSLHPDGLFHAVGDKLEIVLRERRLFRCRLRELAFYEDIDRVSGTDLHVAELHAAHTVDVDAEFSLRPREADGETTIPLEALLATTSRAVGVFRSVNTVSKLTVSREKVSTSDGDVDMASFIHPDVIKPISAASVKECIAFFPI